MTAEKRKALRWRRWEKYSLDTDPPININAFSNGYRMFELRLFYAKTWVAQPQG